MEIRHVSKDAFYAFQIAALMLWMRSDIWVISSSNSGLLDWTIFVGVDFVDFVLSFYKALVKVAFTTVNRFY